MMTTHRRRTLPKQSSLLLALACCASGALAQVAAWNESGQAAPAATAAPPTEEHLEPPEPPDPGPPDPLALRLCETLHALPAARAAACCKATGAPPRGLADECARVLTDAMRSASVGVDPGAVDRCAAATGKAFAGCDWVTPLAAAAPAACRGVIAGKRGEGERCGSPVECAAGLSCADAGMGRVCGRPSPAGFACGRGADPLAGLLAGSPLGPHPECAGYCRLGQCAAATPLEAACKTSRECGPAARCADKRCQAGATAGAGEACNGSDCGDGAVCLAGRCAALKEAGQSCSSPFECRAACIMPPGATSGTCGMKCSTTAADWTPGIR